MNQFKKARLVCGMTQGDLARKVGVSLVTVCKWEHGYTLPRPGRLKEVANALNVTVEELLPKEQGA